MKNLLEGTNIKVNVNIIPIITFPAPSSSDNLCSTMMTWLPTTYFFYSKPNASQ